MTNYKDVLAVREQLANQDHFGSAEAENAQYLDSISGKLNALKQTWISILDTFANSESIKSALDVLISVSEAIDSVVKALDDAGILMHATFGALGSGGNLLKNLAGFGETSYQIKQVGESFELVSTKAKSGTPMIKSIFNSFKEGQTVSQKLSGGFKAVGTSITSSLIPSLKGMLSAGLKGVAVAVAFNTISWAIDKTINKYKNLDKELQTQANTSKSQLESLNKQKSGLESIAEEYDKLSQKSKKTAEEVERYNELKNQIAELAPELVIGLDDDNNPILNLNGSLETYIGNLDSAIERQKTLFANDSLAVGKNALDSLNSSLNWNLAHTYEQDNLELSKQNDAIVMQRQKLVNRLNKINNEYNFKSFEQELSDYAKQSEKYNKTIVEGHQKVQKEHAKITEETLKAQQGMNAKLMNTSAMKQASEETKKLGAQMISAFDLSEVDSNKLDQMIFNMSKNLSSGEFDSSLKKVAELRQELEKTYNFKEYEENIEQYIPSVAKFLGVTEDMARSMLKVPEIMKSSEDALDEFLRSMGKTKQSLNFDVEAQNLAQQFYEVENALSQLTNTANLVEIDGKIQLDPQVVLDMQNNESIPEQIRNLLGEFNKDGAVDLGEIKLLMDVMTAFKLGNTQESQDILAGVQKQLDEILGEGVIDIRELKFDVNGKVENVNIDKKELEEKLSVFGDKEEIKAVFRADVVGLDKVDLFAETVKNLPTDEEHTTKFIVDNAEALSKLNSYQEVIDWIAKNPEVINKYNINVEGVQELEEAKKSFEESGGEKTQKVNVETNAEDAKKTLEETNKQADELSQDINLSVNDGELQGSVESFNKLIEYSSKIKDGEYKLSFTSDTGESIAQINKLKDTVNDLSSAFSSLPSITVRIETAQASKNVTGLRENIEKFNSLSGGLKTITFKTETAQASKNVTGLRNNVSKYITSYCGKSFSTRFNTETALASKNVTGLRNNVSSYVSRYGNKTFTTTFKVVTKYSTEGSPTAQSAGKKPSTPASVQALEPRTISNEVEAQPQPQAQEPSVVMARTSVADAGQESEGSAPSKARTYSKPLETLKYNLNFTTEVEHELKRISNLLDEVSEKAERAFGSEKIKYLQQQVNLYKQQQTALKEYINDLKKEQSAYKSFLSSNGFKFDSTGNIDNYHTKLVAMEKELERLEAISSKDKATDKQKKATEDYRKKLDQVKSALSEYLDITFDELPKANQEWLEVGNTIKDTNNKLEKLAREQKLFAKENRLQSLEMQYDKINDQLNLMKKNMDYNPNSTAFLKEYVSLLEKQKQAQGNIIKQKEEILKVYKNDLGKYGFKFDSSGDISNLEGNLSRYQNSEDLEKVKELVEEYLDLQREQLPDLRVEWAETNNQIKEHKDALEELERTQSLAVYINKLKELKNQYDKLSDELDIIDVKLKHAYGKEKLDLLDQQIKKLEEQKNKQSEIINQYKQLAKVQKEALLKYGIKFDSAGDIENLDEVLNSYKGSADLEKLQGLINEYIQTQRDDLPDAIKEWENLESAIKDALKEQLNVTKEVEDKLTDIYKKQIEKRIELMQKETDEKIKSLKKQQDEYNKYREDTKYNDEYDEKLESINDLQKQLDIAMKDTSLNGQKRVKELQKQLAEAQKALEKFTQDRIDNNINDMFDKEAERIEEENDKAIENLENQWSDSKIAEMVAQALGSGVFTDIEGNVSNLEDALINFADETGELFGVLGSTIKSELITNLQIAQETVKDLSRILSELDLSNIKTSSLVDLSGINSLGRSVSQQSTQVSFTAPLINIEGNVDANVVQDLTAYGEQLKDDIINTIATAIR